MNRDSRLLLFLLFAIYKVSVLSANVPSILLIIADDQGWGDLSCHGNTNLKTPTLDRLGMEGASFERFYVQPVCAPTRAEILTGCYAARCGVTGVTAGDERLASSFPTIADAFAAAGYRTAAFGKWHNGTQAPYHPVCRGFQSFYGFTSGHLADYFSPLIDRNGSLTNGRGYFADDITNEAIEFIKKDNTHPFFAFVAFNTPHSPMQVPDRWWHLHASQQLTERGTQPHREDQDHTRAALAMCENIDWNVERLLSALDESGKTPNTIVMYLSDNGPNGHRYTQGLRGIKGSTDEGGIRSPLFVRWPASIPAGRQVRQLAGAIDLAPTLAELSGIELKPGPPLDGISLATFLVNEHSKPIERDLFTHWNGRTALRRNSMLIDADGGLYDLSTDPGQAVDLSDIHQEETRQLRDAVQTWEQVLIEPISKQPRPFTVGHPALAATQLPARDATVRGGIRRSNRHFNSTFFTHWTDEHDAVVWNIEVLTSGRYRAMLYYTCPEKDAGSLLELRLGSAACRSRVSPGYDPPLLAAEHDRIPRQEGDMKSFRPLDLGGLELDAGRGELTLRALEIPRETVADLNLLVLERID